MIPPDPADLKPLFFNRFDMPLAADECHIVSVFREEPAKDTADRTGPHYEYLHFSFPGAGRSKTFIRCAALLSFPVKFKNCTARSAGVQIDEFAWVVQ